jgi:hypothetical protein
MTGHLLCTGIPSKLFFHGFWGVEKGPLACSTSALPLDPSTTLFGVRYFQDRGLLFALAGLEL